MESSTRHLDVGNNLSCSDEGVIHLGPLEISDPRIFYHAEDKFISLALRGFKGHVVTALGLVYRPLLGADRCLFIVLDRHVVMLPLVPPTMGDGAISGSGGVTLCASPN